jgi:hypothetical protein
LALVVLAEVVLEGLAQIRLSELQLHLAVVAADSI